MRGHAWWWFLVVVSATIPAATSSWVDPDTPASAHTTQSLFNNRKQTIVFSDEFEAEGRAFTDGADPKWTALDKNDFTNSELQYYSSEQAATGGGFLNITTVAEDVTFLGKDDITHEWVRNTKHFKSAMLQTWNKFCFTGGVVEFSAVLPGEHNIGGLWPAVWMMGNLGRATYVGSTNFQWPWSYNECSQDLRRAQEISRCDVVNHYGMHSRQGRGAVEIDLLEVMPGPGGQIKGTPIRKPYVSTSLQIAPGVPEVRGRRPKLGQASTRSDTWYDGMHYGENTSQNVFFYGSVLEHGNSLGAIGHNPDYSYQADALSANTQLAPTHFQRPHTYRMEWQPGEYIRWYLDGALLYSIDQANLQITGADLPREPMYMILNTAISSTWGFPDPPATCTPEEIKKSDCNDAFHQCGLPESFCDALPSSFLVDWIRIYQQDHAMNYTQAGDPQTLGCSPEAFPTETFIEAHAERYKEPHVARPLDPVATGGAACEPPPLEKETESGGDDRQEIRLSAAKCGKGVCDRRLRQCSCDDGWTGPSCLVPVAFYENTPAPGPNPDGYLVFPMAFPSLLSALCGTLAALFVALIVYTVAQRRKSSRYQKIKDSPVKRSVRVLSYHFSAEEIKSMSEGSLKSGVQPTVNAARPSSLTAPPLISKTGRGLWGSRSP